MDIYKEGTMQKVRFTTSRGSLAQEQLFDLSVTDLNDVVVSLDEEYQKSGKKSFIVAKSTKDKLIKLKFDIALDVLNTKLDQAQEALTKKENKEHNERILTLIAEKKDESLKNKSLSQLEAMLK